MSPKLAIFRVIKIYSDVILDDIQAISDIDYFLKEGVILEFSADDEQVSIA